MDHHSEDELRLLAETLPNVSRQIRDSLGNLYIAFSRIATPERRAADSELDQQAALLQQSYFRLLRLADNLTDASRLAEDTPLPMQMTDLAALTEKIFRECQPLAELSGISLQLICEPQVLHIATNPEKVSRVLYQFLSNAFKFTPSGGSITLRCRKDGLHTLISVEDTGCGISDLPSEQLFDRYLQGDPLSPAPHGLGLGLALARQTAQAIGGQVLITSTSSGGTSATLSLPNNQVGAVLRESIFVSPGFPTPLIELSDALPVQAFLHNPWRSGSKGTDLT